MSITGLEMAGSDSAHRSAPASSGGKSEASRSGAPHRDASPASCQTRRGTPVVGQNPCRPPPGAHRAPGSCGPWRRAGHSLLSRGLVAASEYLSAWGLQAQRGMWGKGQRKIEKNGPMAGRNLLTGRCTEGRSEKGKGQGREDVLGGPRRS